LSDLLLPLALVLIAAELGAAIAHALRLPRVVGQITAGLVLGPSVLDVVSDGPQVAFLAGVGALAILATAGLETNVTAMRQVGRPAFLAAVGGVILPFAGGTWLALAVGLDVRSSLFCGAILTATSVGITAATLQELGLMSTRAAVTILGAAVIDDVLGLIVLALVASQAASGGGSPISTLVPMAVAIAAMWVVLRWMPAHLDRVMTTLHGRGGGLAAAVGLVLAAAWAIQTLGGLAGITGAYVAGLALAGSRVAPQVRDGLVRTGEAFCVPVFFVSIGLVADLRTIGPILPFALGLLAVAIVAKLVGSAIGAALDGFGPREASLVGIGMIARGEVALVAASVGLRSGAIGADVYAAAVMVSLVTTIVAPIGISMWCRLQGPLHWPTLEPQGAMLVPVAIPSVDGE
jgi:Kef-type K+ transport system membrane component KefB